MIRDWEKILGNHIVLQAVNDYRNSLRGQKVDNCVSIVKMIEDCEKFFKSDWFGMLTKLDGELLLTQLQEEYENECNSNSSYTRPYHSVK